MGGTKSFGLKYNANTRLSQAVANSKLYKIPGNSAASKCEITSDPLGHDNFSNIHQI